MRQLFHSRSYAYHVLPPFHKTWVLSTGRRIVQRQVFLRKPSTNEMLSVCSKKQLDIHVRAIFNWALNSRFHRFALLCSVIGPENSRHSLDQSDANLTPITIWSPAFSRPFYFLPMPLWLLRFWSEMRFKMNTSKFPIDKTSPSIRHFFRYLHNCNSKIKWRLIFQKENLYLKRTPRVLILFVYHSAHQITAPRALKANSLPSPGIKPRGSAANKTKILTSARIMSCDYPRKISLPKSNE